MEQEDEWTGFSLESPEMPERWKAALSWMLALGFFLVAAVGLSYFVGWLAE